jgi:DNA processing protein
VEGPLVWLCLAKATGVGRVRLGNLMNAVPDPSDAWRLSTADLVQLEGFSSAHANAIVRVRKSPEARREAEGELDRATKAGLRLIALPDPDYPVRMRLTSDPPPYFYQGGPWTPDARPVVAIIGTRKPTSYGLSIADRFAAELAKAGVVIVSGMARGIDCAAHSGALRAGGQTVAVLGGGADICYPREAWGIYRKMCETGAVISEQPPGTAPRSEFFPERNRIISALAHGILVVEAGENSGTLITVGAALRQGRDVFAIPGPITSPMSHGPHALIRDGACLVTSPQMILEELGFTSPVHSHRTPDPELAPRELRLLGWMGELPRWADDLAEACSLSIGEVQSSLTLLELMGFVQQLRGGQYVIVR